jgi:hypothetical protein
MLKTQSNMNLTITLDGITRTFHVEDTDIINTDWNEDIQDMLDTIESVK